MLKKTLLLLLFSCFLNVLLAQVKKTTPQLVKYVTTAPDGTTSITIYEDSRSNLIQLERKFLQNRTKDAGALLISLQFLTEHMTLSSSPKILLFHLK